MRPIVIDGIAWSFYQSVCHDHDAAKTAEPIEMPFGLWTGVGQRHHVLDEGPDPPGEGGILRGKRQPIVKYTVHVRWRCILLSNYFDHLFSSRMALYVTF